MLNSTCQNCHGVNGVFSGAAVNTSSVPGDWTKVTVPVSPTANYLGHAQDGRTSRQMMDKAEQLVNGGSFDTTDGSDGVCAGCHGDNSASVSCSEPKWLQHLTKGRVAESVWEQVSLSLAGSRCGW